MASSKVFPQPLAHSHNCLALYAIHDSVEEVLADYLTPNDLAELGIRREEMKLDGNGGPLFYSQ
jgi:hypothetical protein